MRSLQLLLLQLSLTLLSLGVFVEANPEKWSNRLIQKLPPSISQRLPGGKKEYTPLVFFKFPKGLNPQSDELEKVVTQIEKELDVNVERMDVVRDKWSFLTLSQLTSSMNRRPVLYNRESREIILMDPMGVFNTDEVIEAEEEEEEEENDEEGEEQKKKAKAVSPVLAVDVDRVRAWAKGRRLVNRRESVFGEEVEERRKYGGF